jgi:hypothetical protein
MMDRRAALAVQSPCPMLVAGYADTNTGCQQLLPAVIVNQQQSPNNKNTGNAIFTTTISPTSTSTVVNTASNYYCTGGSTSHTGLAARTSGRAAMKTRHGSGAGIARQSPLRSAANARERERRHLDSLNYWKREHGNAVDRPPSEHRRGSGQLVTEYFVRFNQSDNRQCTPAKLTHGNRATTTQAAQRGRTPPFPVVAAERKEHKKVVAAVTAAANDSANLTNDNGTNFATISTPTANKRALQEADFAKKLSPIQNSPLFFNQHLCSGKALYNNGRLTSPPPPKLPLPAMATGFGLTDLRSQRLNFTHHKSAFYQHFQHETTGCFEPGLEGHVSAGTFGLADGFPLTGGAGKISSGRQQLLFGGGHGLNDEDDEELIFAIEI